MVSTKKTRIQKVKVLTLNNNFEILEKFFNESVPILDFAYMAKFNYSSKRIDSIKIFDNKQFICQITKKDIENFNPKNFSNTKSIETITKNACNGDIASIKSLFLYKCIIN